MNIHKKAKLTHASRVLPGERRLLDEEPERWRSLDGRGPTVGLLQLHDANSDAPWFPPALQHPGPHRALGNTTSLIRLEALT